MKRPQIIVGVVIVLVVAIISVFLVTRSAPTTKTPIKPTPAVTEQLPANKQPTVSLKFSADGHYVTVNINNINADQLEYNLIYDAVVKGNNIQTGVNSTATMTGKSTYSKQQLLGSESSGKFTYHESIANAIMELTLRDSTNRSIFTASYPFEVSPGATTPIAPVSE